MESYFSLEYGCRRVCFLAGCVYFWAWLGSTRLAGHPMNSRSRCWTIAPLALTRIRRAGLVQADWTIASVFNDWFSWVDFRLPELHKSNIRLHFLILFWLRLSDLRFSSLMWRLCGHSCGHRHLFLFLDPYFATLTRYLTLIFIFRPLFCHPYKIFDPYFYF
jgi:hypothetical protein